MKKLPITEPLIKGYNHHAFLFSIISKSENCLPWIYSNFIQLVFDNNNQKLDFLRSPFWTAPCIDYELFYKDKFINNNINIIEYIVSSINKGYYFHTKVNEYYIPNRRSYGKQDFDHGIFIYGYNKEKRLFHIFGFDKNSILRETEIKFNQLLNAFKKSGKNYKVIFFKKKNDFVGLFNKNWTIKQFEDYLYSKNTYERNEYISCNFNNLVYGFNTYNSVISSIQSDKLDIRHLHILWEHKKIMKYRLNYIINNYELKELIPILKQYHLLENTCFILRNLLLKYKIMKNDILLNKITNGLNKVYTNEKLVLEKLLTLIYTNEKLMQNFNSHQG